MNRVQVMWDRLCRRKPPEMPQGVRILHGDGRVSECTVILDPSREGDLNWWMLVPPDGIRFDPEAGDAIRIDELPGCTMVYISRAPKETGMRGCP